MGKLLKIRQSRENNSVIYNDSPIELNVHNPIMIIHIQYKFHEIPSIGYLVMAGDRQKSFEVRKSKGNNSALANDMIKFTCITSL